MGLCALVIGLMAVSATRAMALPEWMVENKILTEYTPNLEPTLGAQLENNVGIMLTEINGVEVEIECHGIELINLKLKPGGVTSRGKIKFTGCGVFDPEGELPCTVKSAGSAVGTIESKEVEGKLELHTGGVPITLIFPVVGEELAALRIEGAECLLPEIVPVIGKVAIKDAENKFEVEIEKHLFVEFATLTELYVINKTNMEHLAFLDGSVLVGLTGVGHVNKRWSGLAG